MLLDNPKSVLIIGGTPKGKRHKGQTHKFYELIEYAEAHKKDGWSVSQYSTYDNPLLSKKDIDEIIEEMPASMVDQEIYGKFLDIDDATLIDTGLINQAMSRQPSLKAYEMHTKIMGVDVGWGSDPAVVAKRQGNMVWPLIEIPPQKDDTVMAARIATHIQEFQPDYVFMDYGFGTGIISILNQLGFGSVTGVWFGGGASDAQKYSNIRAEMYDHVRSWLVQGGCLPKDKMLNAELASQLIEHDNKGRLKLATKDKIKALIGRSPDRADALALTHAYHVPDKRMASDDLIGKSFMIDELNAQIKPADSMAGY